MKKIEHLLLLIVFLSVAIFYVWTVRSTGYELSLGHKQMDYYNLLIDGWLDGHLYLKVDVPEALLKVSNPYDPTLRPTGIALHDASFYKGKYYIYFGAVAAATVMFPFRMITQMDLPLPLTVILFAYTSYLVSCTLLLSIRKNCFPKSSSQAALISTLVLGLVSLSPILLRRPQMWELPTTAGSCFAVIALYWLWKSLNHLNKYIYVSLFSVFIGLAIASRPTYIVGVPLLSLPVIYGYKQKGNFSVITLVAAIIPLSVIGILVGVHNYLRFDNFFEFGQNYQLSFDYESKVTHFSLHYLGFNVWRYFFSVAHVYKYFPFISPADLPLKPKGMGGNDDVYGLFTHLPILWLSIIPVLSVLTLRKVVSVLHAWLISPLVLFLGLSFILCCFFGSMSRYSAELTPPLTVLSCVGILQLENSLLNTKRFIRKSVQIICITAALISCSFVCLYSFQINRYIAERNPSEYKSLAHLLNRIPSAIDTLLDNDPKSCEIVFKIPTSDKPRTELLLSVRNSLGVDRIFIRTLDERHIQLGFVRDSLPEILSPSLDFDYTAQHTLKITLGSFFPPTEDIYFKSLSGENSRLLSRLIALNLDNTSVLKAFREFIHTGSSERLIGSQSLSTKQYGPFSGEVLHSKGVPIIAEECASTLKTFTKRITPTAFHFRVHFVDTSTQIYQPLLVSGSVGKADLLGVSVSNQGILEFIFDHWGSKVLKSEKYPFDPKINHILVIKYPWLNPTTLGTANDEQTLAIECDGHLLWKVKTPGYFADPEEIYIAENPLGGSYVGSAFKGKIYSFE